MLQKFKKPHIPAYYFLFSPSSDSYTSRTILTLKVGQESNKNLKHKWCLLKYNCHRIFANLSSLKLLFLRNLFECLCNINSVLPFIFHVLRCPWCNGCHHGKWTRRHKFKSWTRLIAFLIELVPLGKVWIRLFSLQLWVNSRADLKLKTFKLWIQTC